MPANYLHGVETIEASSGSRPVRVVKSAVIGIIGTDPVAPYDTPILILSKKDAAEKLGPALSQFTLRKHVDKILDQGAATIIAINVYGSSPDHSEMAEDEQYVVQDGKVQLTNQITSVDSLTVANQAGTTTYLKGEDYSIDVYGTIRVLKPDVIEDLSTVTVTYRYHEVSMISNNDVIGSISADRELTGLKAFGKSFTLFGFTPKIFIAPVFCESDGVAKEMIITANQFRGRALIDATSGSNITDCITGRGPLGEINFYTSSKRAVLCFPHFEVFAPWMVVQGRTIENFGLSTFLAGVWTKTINDEGYWVSPSNKEMLGVNKPDVLVTSAINDPQTDANLLNENGIVTYFNSFGTGYRTWGNRSAAWPTDTAVDNFLPVLMTADVIDESIELAMLPFIDKPLTNATIDAIKETVNGFLNSLVQRGAILPGAECIYDSAENPVSELALGHVTFLDKYLPPTPAERITFKRYLATELLANLGQ